MPALVTAQKTSYDYDKTADFATFRTYALKDGTKVGQPLIDDRIMAAIETQLAEKKLTKVEANPDVFVVYHMAFDTQKDISTYSSGYGGGYGPYGWGWGGGWAGGTTSTQVRDIVIGTLVIDIADAKRSQLAWRGMGVREVQTQANPEKRDKSINEAVKKIFKNYPPKEVSESAAAAARGSVHGDSTHRRSADRVTRWCDGGRGAGHANRRAQHVECHASRLRLAAVRRAAPAARSATRLLPVAIGRGRCSSRFTRRPSRRRCSTCTRRSPGSSTAA